MGFRIVVADGKLIAQTSAMTADEAECFVGVCGVVMEYLHELPTESDADDGEEED